MAKKIKTIITIQIQAGKANPSPPIGPTLAPHGINLMMFCKEYNARTSDRMGDIIPAKITVFTDGSFKFDLKTPPTPFLIKKAAGVPRGASRAPGEIVGKITSKQVREIAEKKLPDMNARDLDAAMTMVRGTCINMGIEVVD
ncbi:MAG: 50S ribosomal protein L11 [Phototrophicaceae bacterium]|jgi:large subunit ribosomal protein L11